MADGSQPPGGSVAYAAAALTAYGIKACVVTAAGKDADLSVFDGHDLHVIHTEQTLTFEHTHSEWGTERQLRVTADPGVTLSASHVPQHCRRARLILLGPLVLNDLDASSFLAYNGVWDRLLRAGQRIGLMGQGYQRKLDRSGVVTPIESPTPQLLAGLSPSVSLFLSDVEVHTWGPGVKESVAASCRRLVVTEGKKGHTEHNSTGAFTTTAHDTDDGSVADTNGAGDVFATAFMVAMLLGHQDPGSHASWAASRAVMQEQQCKPACAGTLLSAAVNPQLSTSTAASLITGRLSQLAGSALGWQQKVQLAYHSLRVMSSEAAVALQRLVTVHASSLNGGGGGGGGG
ncbi:MAG: hypothetical protein WDW38_004064 [Sanguina aurantia]